MAGLFDPTMFDPSSFGGSQAGLLARLAGMAAYRPTPQTVLPGQPGTDAMASGIIPPQGAPPPQPQAPMSLPGQAPQGGGGFMDALQGFLGNHSNALMGLGAGIASGGLQRGVGGLAQGGQLDYQRNMQQGSLAAMFHALKSAGASDAEATMGAMSPEGFKAISAKYLDPQLMPTEIGTDLMGNKIMGTFNKRTGQYTDTAGKPIDQNGSGATTAVPKDANGMPLQGPELLQHLEQSDPIAAAGVKGLISGDLNAQGRNLQKLAPLAKLVDPTFDASQYPVRVGVRKSYTSGKDFQEAQALNTVAGHMGNLMNSAQALNPSDWVGINSLRSLISDYGTTNPALVKFRNDLVTTQNELAKAYHGGHVSDSAYNAFNKSVNENMSLPGIKAGIGELGNLLQSKIEAKESGYRSSMAGTPLPAEYRAINDHAAQSFQNINNWANGGPAPAAAPTQATAPLTPPITAINALKQNPALRDQFDAKYGPGMSAKVMGQ